MGLRVWDNGKSESRSVMERIEVASKDKITSRESGQTSTLVLNHAKEARAVNRMFR